MRKYTLASSTARKNVDLREYRDIIEEAVHSILPSATVTVNSDCYMVSPTPSKSQAIKIGRKICQSAMAQYCVQIPKLFISTELSDITKEENNDKQNQQKCIGGHF